MSATTDSFGEISYDFELRPGVSNLLQILAHLSGKTIDDTVREWRGKSSYGELKKATASVVEQFLTGFQQRVEQVDEEQLRIKLETSEKAMLEFANKKLQLVQTAVGLR
jgi:tryptophanyl-tRNA synthetase